MTDVMTQLMLFASILAPIILAVVEAVKRTEKVSAKLLPFVALALGILIGFAAQPFTDLDLALRLWAGGLAGLAATGLFELGTNRSKE
jgi:hypothetical protein